MEYIYLMNKDQHIVELTTKHPNAIVVQEIGADKQLDALLASVKIDDKIIVPELPQYVLNHCVRPVSFIVSNNDVELLVNIQPVIAKPAESTPTSSKLTQHDWERVRMMRAQGYKLREIAEAVGISDASISRYLNDKQHAK